MLECVWSGREASTVNKYCLCLRKVISFISLNGYSKILPFTSAFAAEYLTHLRLTSGTKGAIESALASLKWIHSFVPGVNAWNNPMNDEFLSKMLSSAKRSLVSKRNQKKPIRGKMIRDMIANSNLDNHVELRNCVLMGLSFSLLLRHDEVIHITLNHITEIQGGYKILIPKSKTDKFRNGSHVLLKKSDKEYSISRLFEKYLSMFGLKLGLDHFLFFPLFSKIGKCNKILSYASCRDIVKGMITLIGLDSTEFSTHSCRSGGATELSSNVTEHELLVSGRWRDPNSIRSYVELSDKARLSIANMLQDSISDE